MSTSLEGRVAIVTGAGRGIGRAAAQALAALGASVLVNDPGVSERGSGEDRSFADEVAEAIRAAGGTTLASYDSVAEFESTERIIETAQRELGGVDILVDNAGIAAGAPVQELDPELFATVVGVHLFGTFHCTRHAVESMRAQGWGRVVNLVSRAALLGSAGSSAYAAGKGGIYGFTNSASRDLGRFGITMNSVSPAATLTRMIDGAAERAKASGLDSSVAERMLAVAQKPEQVATLIAFLCTEAAAGMEAASSRLHHRGRPPDHASGSPAIAPGPVGGRTAPTPGRPPAWPCARGCRPRR